MRAIRDANAQHPHDLFTTASRLSPIVAGMQTNDATLAHHGIDETVPLARRGASAAMPMVADEGEVV